MSGLTRRNLCGGDGRICGVDDGVRRLHITGGVAVVELDTVQGGVTRLGLVTAVGDFKDELEGEMSIKFCMIRGESYLVSVEVDLTSPPLLVPLRAVVRQVPDVVSKTIPILC